MGTWEDMFGKPTEDQYSKGTAGRRRYVDYNPSAASSITKKITQPSATQALSSSARNNFHTYYNPETKQFEYVPKGYAGTGVEYQTQQTGKPYYVEPASFAKGTKGIYSPKEQANITYYNFQPSTSGLYNTATARVPTPTEATGQGYNYYSGVPSQAAQAAAKTYQPRTETVLKNTLKDYISNPLRAVQDLFAKVGQSFQEPFGTQPAYAQGETPTQAPGQPKVVESWQQFEPMASRGGEKGLIAQTLGFHPEYYGQQPMQELEARNIDTYLDTAANVKQETTALERIIEGARTGVVMPENVSASPKYEVPVNVSMVEHGDISPQFYEAQSDTGLADFVKQIRDKVADVPISGERLDAIQDEGSLASLWDTGYKAPKVISGVMDSFNQFQSQTNIPLFGIDDPQKIQSIDYRSLVDAIHDISGEGKYSPADFQRMIDDGKTMRLETSYKGTDAFGNPTFSASWNTDVPFEPKKKTAAQTEADYWENYQTDVNHYWDSREVEQRNKQREESWEWSHNKDLEGWTDYYASLNSLKLTPFMNEWASSTAMFNELRKIWETTAKGKSWTDFLKGYDFFSQWFAQRPESRGEKPTAFAPILQGASRL